MLLFSDLLIWLNLYDDQIACQCWCRQSANTWHTKLKSGASNLHGAGASNLQDNKMPIRIPVTLNTSFRMMEAFALRQPSCSFIGVTVTLMLMPPALIVLAVLLFSFISASFCAVASMDKHMDAFCALFFQHFPPEGLFHMFFRFSKYFRLPLKHFSGFAGFYHPLRFCS